MKIYCNQKELFDAVSNVQKAVANKSTIPALEGILIETNNNAITISGYNLELAIVTCINATVQQNGSIVLNAKLFFDIVRKLPDEEVLIEVDNKLITNIKSGLSNFSIIGINSSDYPQIPKPNDLSSISIDASVLKSMIKQTIFAVSVNDNKPVYTGSLFEINENSINLVSIDGCRLAMRTEEFKSSINKQIKFIVPGKTLQEIVRLIDEKEQIIKLLISPKHILFHIGNYTVISRLLEGNFIDYKLSIPNSYKSEATINVYDFIDSLDRVSLLLTGKLKSPVRCIFDQNTLKLSCITSIGKANDELAISMKGEHTEIGFNNKYLLDALRNSDCDEVKVYLNDSLGPIKISPMQGNSFLFLVLPIKI